MSPILPSDAPTADALSPALPNRPMDSSATGALKTDDYASDCADDACFFCAAGERDRAKLEGAA